MGLSTPPNRCFLTNIKTTNFPSSYDLIEYFIEFYGSKLLFRFHYNYTNSKSVKENKHIIQGLIFNNKFPKEYFKSDGPVLNNELIENIVNDAIFPTSPDEKIDNLLDYLHSLQEFEGATIKFPEINMEVLARKLYFKNYSEMIFYLFTLKEQGLVNGREQSTKQGIDLAYITLTYKGLSKIIEINESGNQSNRCFVAMSFSEELEKNRSVIKSAIIKAGYSPILIDEIHYDADVTINDALIAEIKKCKFLVADFTEHKHGVYFEAGFALGLKRPVIYLCEQNHFENTHFDTNHYPHIIYSNLDNLENKLETKINAWIN